VTAILRNGRKASADGAPVLGDARLVPRCEGHRLPRPGGPVELRRLSLGVKRLRDRPGVFGARGECVQVAHERCAIGELRCNLRLPADLRRQQVARDFHADRCERGQRLYSSQPSDADITLCAGGEHSSVGIQLHDVDSNVHAPPHGFETDSARVPKDDELPD
jgi:hypothetical protein